MSKELTKETEEVIKKKSTFGDQFDFSNMFRVKGKKGLVALISHKKGSETCVVCNIYDRSSKRFEVVKNMVCLGSLGFMTTKEEQLTMSEVFTNISNYCINSDDYGFEKTTIEELMPFMVHNFDKDHFKKYHAEQVLSWYIEITLKYSALLDEAVKKGDIEKVEDKS